MNNITSVIPHRYPFLMVDRVLETEPGRWARGYKNVSWNEWYITEQNSSMPSTMIIEALAQLGAFAAISEGGGLGFLSSLNGVEVSGVARPGDRVDLYYEVKKNKRGFVVGIGEASIEGQVIIRVQELMIYLQNQERT
ncbi:3-hydroxyacyl-ACP dehydratase FabZ family protein [Paenibacillus kobensis]|uniref:3-hydroxyacyl-ACP dehydratase FabZ family protein n=1 Tax=Paenibacillus kobensis TaxID=59841 RepID=UPI000FD80FBF|nr:3-hydroxyacyl-ACP dehydratase FabZ family protein [Paenibacillus kobensis]